MSSPPLPSRGPRPLPRRVRRDDAPERPRDLHREPAFARHRRRPIPEPPSGRCRIPSSPRAPSPALVSPSGPPSSDLVTPAPGSPSPSPSPAPALAPPVPSAPTSEDREGTSSSARGPPRRLGRARRARGVGPLRARGAPADDVRVEVPRGLRARGDLDVRPKRRRGRLLLALAHASPEPAEPRVRRDEVPARRALAVRERPPVGLVVQRHVAHARPERAGPRGTLERRRSRRHRGASDGRRRAEHPLPAPPRGADCVANRRKVSHEH